MTAIYELTAACCLQIVLATNIAETAVTIDDVVCVINSGRMKEKSYDPYTVNLFYFANLPLILRSLYGILKVSLSIGCESMHFQYS